MVHALCAASANRCLSCTGADRVSATGCGRKHACMGGGQPASPLMERLAWPGLAWRGVGVAWAWPAHRAPCVVPLTKEGPSLALRMPPKWFWEYTLATHHAHHDGQRRVGEGMPLRDRAPQGTSTAISALVLDGIRLQVYMHACLAHDHVLACMVAVRLPSSSRAAPCMPCMRVRIMHGAARQRAFRKQHGPFTRVRNCPARLARTYPRTRARRLPRLGTCQRRPAHTPCGSQHMHACMHEA